MDKITIDGRFLVVAVLFLFIFAAFIITTLNIWHQNADLKRRLGWDENRCRANFLDWLSYQISIHPVFKIIIIMLLVPFVAIYIWIKHPAECFKKLKKHFSKQIKKASEDLFNG